MMGYGEFHFILYLIFHLYFFESCNGFYLLSWSLFFRNVLYMSGNGESMTFIKKFQPQTNETQYTKRVMKIIEYAPVWKVGDIILDIAIQVEGNGAVGVNYSQLWNMKSDVDRWCCISDILNYCVYYIRILPETVVCHKYLNVTILIHIHFIPFCNVIIIKRNSMIIRIFDVIWTWSV